MIEQQKREILEQSFTIKRLQDRLSVMYVFVDAGLRRIMGLLLITIRCSSSISRGLTSR